MNKKIKELWEQAAQRDDIMDEKRYEHIERLEHICQIVLASGKY